MYSEIDLDKIVGFYKTPVKPIHIKNIADINRHPNDILLSYFMSEEGLGKNELASHLRNLQELEVWLELCAPKKLSEEELPLLWDSMDYNMPTSNISASIETRTTKFALGYDDKLIVADKIKKRHIYPSGCHQDYYLLINEKSANVPIFNCGYGNINPDEIFVRENSIIMLSAVAELLKYTRNFEEYRGYIKDFDNYIAGIIIAHEKNEIELVKAGKILQRTFESELLVEKYARDFLLKQNVNIKYWELFHLISATLNNEREKNVSAVITKQEFQLF